MSYTGDVQVGGRAEARELPGLTVTKVAVGPYDNNAYVLRCTSTGEQLLIDAANEAPRLLELIGYGRRPDAGAGGGAAAGGPLSRIVTTHRHEDHWTALDEVVNATQAPVVAHPRDARILPVPVSEPVEHGDTVRVGAARLEVIHLRGHTPGSIALLYEADGELAGNPHLFTGDSLFPGGVGNTWGDAQRFEQLLSDVQERIFDRLPDATWFYPGHGKDSTLGRERPSLPQWRARGW